LQLLDCVLRFAPVGSNISATRDLRLSHRTRAKRRQRNGKSLQEKADQTGTEIHNQAIENRPVHVAALVLRITRMHTRQQTVQKQSGAGCALRCPSRSLQSSALPELPGISAAQDLRIDGEPQTSRRP
jgi:hypothetical protein